MGYQQATRKRFSLLKGELLASERNKQQKPAELSAGRLVPGDQGEGALLIGDLRLKPGRKHTLLELKTEETA